MPLQATSGAASYDAFGGGVAAVPKYIEEYFSTYLYQGTGASNTINNGIDLATKGGLVWTKARNLVEDHNLFDTARGVRTTLNSNTTAAQYQADPTYFLTAFNSNGFTMGLGDGNANGYNYTSWTLAKAPKFFDVVTYTGNGSGNRIITSSLGSPIGCIFIKRTDSTSNWATAHRKDGSAVATGLSLNTTAAALYPNSTNDTFDATGGFNAGYIVDSTGDGVNVNGATYVAYLFAHNAGGFGLTGTDNVISCGSFDANNGEVINLGYEPQWLLYKASSDVDNWRIADNMRGLTNLAGTNAQTIKQLRPNSSAVESENSGPVLTSTGFTWNQSGGGVTHIYIAIRRGPMKVPTSGTSVFTPIATSATTGTAITTNFPVDLQFWGDRGGNGYNFLVSDRLRGVVTSPVTATSPNLQTAVTAAEITIFNSTRNWNNTGYQIGSSLSGVNAAYWNFRRAPSFFDVVCYTGTGSSGLVINHNLTVVPEFIIVKERTNDGIANWSACYNFTSTTYVRDILNRVDSVPAVDNYGSGGNNYAATPTATTITVGTSLTNANGSTYVAYLFATCAGVSKVGSFTGNGSSQTINCGFTGGARFVLIKKSSGTGDWMVSDSARGIVSGNDPYLELNNTNAEVTGEDWLDTDSTGFVVNEVSGSNANTNGATYIFLAIA